MRKISGLLLMLLVAMASCKNEPQNNNHGPIVLGDSSTIVTETDPELLKDQVIDLRPVSENEPGTTDTTTPPAPVKDTASTPTAENTPPAPAPTVTTTPAPLVGNGLTVAFKEVTIFIPSITTRSYGKPDLQRARGASYELKSGNLAGNQLRIVAGTVNKVTQRYQTVLSLKDGNDLLPLTSLGTYASEWEALSGSKNAFNLTGLNNPEYKEVGAAAIRNAVQQTARRERMNRTETQDWQDIARKVRNTNQAPCVVVLTSVSWRIEGKDANGRSFNKELRIDLPY